VTGWGSAPVRLKLIDEQDFSHYGRIDFIDNVVDRSTGTIRGRAQFVNSDGLFTPGMFARVQVPASTPYEALMVPDAAIGTEQVRRFVYVVDQDNVARQCFVALGQVLDGLRVIKEGLSADDRVVINGLMRVRPGQKVTSEEHQAPAPEPRLIEQADRPMHSDTLVDAPMAVAAIHPDERARVAAAWPATRHARERRKGALNSAGIPHIDRAQLDTEGGSYALHCRQLADPIRCGGIPQDCRSRCPWCGLLEKP
jgi:hypothetical protein